ncbi:MAG: YIP1 family protein [Candidatus Tumulicola sp.]
MEVEAPGKARANGLKTVLDVIIAPREAFEQLRAAPTWGWALLILLVLYALASWLITPGVVHATQSDWPRTVASNPSLAQMTPDQQQHALTFTLRIVSLIWLFSPVVAMIAVVVLAIVMLIFKALGRGSASFATIWAAAVNIQVPILAINGLVTAAIVMLRGADTFNSSADIQTAMPSLALLVDPASLKLHAFASAFNPFTLWGIGLVVGAMTISARVSRGWAWATAIVWILAAACFIALAAR